MEVEDLVSVDKHRSRNPHTRHTRPDCGGEHSEDQRIKVKNSQLIKS